MQFAYIKHLAEQVANEKVTDVVVAVPPYFSQFERDAVVDAIEISGLRTLALINDGTAVAINYAMTRTFATPEYHIIYDAGASGIRATLASFTTATDPKTGSSGTHIAVAGVGYDRNSGGTELDRRMREMLIDAFNAKTKRDVREDKKGMVKLWKEAQRVKAILSANTEAVATIESLAWDIDFKTKVTRSAFESVCKDLKGQFAKPIEDALRNAGLTLVSLILYLALVSLLIIVCLFAFRTTLLLLFSPEVVLGYQWSKLLSKKWLEGTYLSFFFFSLTLTNHISDKIALNVNADEAAVLGKPTHSHSSRN